MENNTYVIHGNDVLFGLADISVPWGVVMSLQSDPTKELKEYPNQGGNTGTVVTYNAKTELKIEILRAAKAPGEKAADLPTPQVDDVVEMSGKQWLVIAVSESKPIDDAHKATLTLRNYPDVALTTS